MRQEMTGMELPRLLQSALIVDDHPLFCDALAMTLSAAAGITAVETVGCLEDALARVARQPLPDVILLDLNLPDVNGLDGLIRLRAAVLNTPIVVVSSLDEARVIRAAIRAGATGYVPKHSPREMFREAFTAIAEGRIHAPEGTLEAEGDAGSAREQAILRLSLLTRQQANILKLICAGRMNKQIAWELQIAETTVKAHVTAIMRKLGVQSRTQAVLLTQEASFSNLLPED